MASEGSASAGFVREARASDAPGLARIQVSSWRSSLAGLVPGEVLDQLGSAEEQFAQQWREAITSPPTSKHKVHVAVDRSASGPSEPLGFAAAGPATDEDKWPGTDGQLYELHVLPGAAADGHAERLLNAVADTLGEDGFRTACTWAVSGDAPRVSFLTEAGWAEDGASSNLDMGVKVHVIRLHTRISEPGQAG